MALLLYEKYSLQPYDSKIIASALLAGCDILYSEDMQHGLIVENRLTSLIPFYENRETI
jgi:predicted nucleic acid-binding protein